MTDETTAQRVALYILHIRDHIVKMLYLKIHHLLVKRKEMDVSCPRSIFYKAVSFNLINTVLLPPFTCCLANSLRFR